MSPYSWQPLRSSLALATWTPQNDTKAWSRRSLSSRWSSWRPSWPSVCSSRLVCMTASAICLFPLYLLAINIFVLPITFGGLLRFPGGNIDADTFVLTLPMVEHREGLALFVFIGGMSAATGMVIVETIALSTMVCNDLVMPVLLRLKHLRLNEREDL